MHIKCALVIVSQLSADSILRDCALSLSHSLSFSLLIYVKFNDHECPMRFTQKKSVSRGKSAHEHTLHVRCTTLKPFAGVHNSINSHTTTSAVFWEEYCCCQLARASPRGGGRTLAAVQCQRRRRRGDGARRQRCASSIQDKAMYKTTRLIVTARRHARS